MFGTSFHLHLLLFFAPRRLAGADRENVHARAGVDALRVDSAGHLAVSGSALVGLAADESHAQGLAAAGSRAQRLVAEQSGSTIAGLVANASDEQDLLADGSRAQSYAADESHVPRNPEATTMSKFEDWQCVATLALAGDQVIDAAWVTRYSPHTLSMDGQYLEMKDKSGRVDLKLHQSGYEHNTELASGLSAWWSGTNHHELGKNIATLSTLSAFEKRWVWTAQNLGGNKMKLYPKDCLAFGHGCGVAGNLVPSWTCQP